MSSKRRSDRLCRKRSRASPVATIDLQRLEDSVKLRQEHVSEEIKRIQASRFQLVKPGLNLLDLWTPVRLEEPGVFYKVVSAANGSLFSVFDGTTEYHLGRWSVAKRGAIGWPPLHACYFGYPTPPQAVAADFPRTSKLVDAPKVLVQILAKGRAYRRVGDVWAFERIKILSLVSQSARGGAFVIAAKYMEGVDSNDLQNGKAGKQAILVDQSLC
ncbi:hypothetical protein BSKO_07633 [Bryopsis sp. KO-2023]|nr:hypothetical protein BSKO_07633 [Bryopsis sp. KO-2023]